MRLADKFTRAIIYARMLLGRDNTAYWEQRIEHMRAEILRLEHEVMEASKREQAALDEKERLSRLAFQLAFTSVRSPAYAQAMRTAEATFRGPDDD